MAAKTYMTVWLTRNIWARWRHQPRHSMDAPTTKVNGDRIAKARAMVHGGLIQPPPGKRNLIHRWNRRPSNSR